MHVQYMQINFYYHIFIVIMEFKFGNFSLIKLKKVNLSFFLMLYKL